MAKRGRKPLNKRKGYFFENEEEAIKAYINSNNEEEKNEIYNTILMPAFDKMVSSIIRRYHLYVADEDYEDTFHDSLSYLLTKIGNFDPDKGCKAYSYCGTIIKNYLMQKNTQYYKKLQKLLPYDDVIEDINNNNQYDLQDVTFKSEAPLLIKATSEEILKMIENAEENKLTEKEIKVGYALYNLLSNWEEILDDNGSNKMNKSNVLYFLREQTNMSTKDFRDNMKKYKKAYKVLKNILLS